VVGVVDVTIVVNDSNGGVASQSFQIDVEAMPTGPMIMPVDDISGLVGEELNLTIAATDAQGGDLTLSISPLPLPEGLTFNAVTGQLRWPLTADNVGASTVTITATSSGSTVSESFTVSVAQPDPSAPTGVSGRVYDATAGANGEDLPIVGAVVELQGTGLSATTDSDGAFTLSGDINGGQLLTINGGVAQLAPDGSTYANFQEQIVLPPRIVTFIDRPFYMPRINAGSVTQLGPEPITLVSNTDIGASLEVFTGQVKNPDGSTYTGSLSISEVPANLAPVALPDFLDPALLVTVQPAGLEFAVFPLPLTLPNLDDLPPGTLLDLWAVDPERGVFTIVGMGEVSADGETIETIEGGLVDSTWALFRQMPVQSEPNENTKGPNKNTKKNCKKKAGSSVEIDTGCMLTNFSLPAYRSQTQSRQMGFVYKSIRAHPTEVLSIDTNIPNFTPTPNAMAYELNVGGLTVREPVYVNPNSPDGLIRRSRSGIPFDTSAHTTGVYNYDVTTRAFYRFSSTVDTLGGELVVVNESDSPFGAGWGLSDLKRLYLNDSGRFLMVDGDGSQQVFNQQRPIVIGSLNAARSLKTPDGAFNYSFVDSELFGAFKSDLLDPSRFGPDGTVARRVSLRPGLGELTLEALEGLDIFVLTQEEPDAQLTFSERAVLEQFVQEGGALLELTPEPRDEPVLGTSSELAINPGNSLPFFFDFQSEHPVVLGPFGRNVRFFGGINVSVYDDIGAGTMLASRSGGPTVVDFPIGLENAAGAALLIGDASLAISGFPEPTGNSNILNRYITSSQTGLLNAIVYLGDVPGFRADSDLGGEEFFGPAGDYSELVRLPDGTFKQTMKDGTVYGFDADGFQISKTDRNGNATTYSYSADGLLELMTDPKGLETTFTYAGGKLQYVSDPAGRVSTFMIDSNGDLLSVTFPDGATKSYVYDENHLMLQETNERGFATMREYDQFGFFSSSTLPDGSKREFAPARSVPSGISQESATPAIAASQVFSSYADGNGDVSFSKTDRLGQVSEKIDSEQRTWIIDRDIDGNSLRIVYPNGLQRSHQYDELGNELTDSNSLDGGTQTYTFGQYSLLASIVDELGGTTSFERDDSGNPTRTLNPVNHQTLMSWDQEGRLIGATTPNGLQTTIEYNGRGLAENLLFEPTTGASRSASYEYDGAGQMIRSVSPSGLDTSLEYDDRGRLTRVSDNLGRVFTLAYNLSGEIISSEVLDGQTVRRFESFVYDSLGRLTQNQRPHQGNQSTYTYTYDQDGNETSSTDSSGDVTSYQYDSVDRLIAIVDSEGGVAEYQYNLDDTRTLVKAPNGAETTFEYDLLGRMLSESSPDRGLLAYTYDLKGRELTTTDGRGIVTSYNYDAIDRVVSKSFPAPGENVAYQYDTCSEGIGLICSRTDEAGSHSWTYDEFGNFLTNVSVVGGVERQVEYTYNAIDGVISTTLPSGRVVSYSRDAANRVTEISSSVNGITVPVINSAQYRADNMPIRIEYGNSVVETKDYDTQGRLSSWIVVGQNAQSLLYDSDSNLKSIDSEVFAATYEYDSLNRLIEDVTGNNNVDASYSYDPSGNRLTSMSINTNTSYEYAEGTNRLVSIGGIARTFDAGGNLIQDEIGRVHTYNQANRVASIFDPISGETFRYLYNDDGLRIRKVANGSVIVYTYDVQGRLVSETDELGAAIREYIWLGEMPIAQIDIDSGLETITYIHSDHLATPRIATGAGGAVTWRWHGDAFGSSNPNEDPNNSGASTKINLRFPGQYYDAETELHYNHFRTYNPSAGRYLSSDPTGLDGGLNSYAYADLSPTNMIDEDGLVSSCGPGGIKCAKIGAQGNRAIGAKSKLNKINTPKRPKKPGLWSCNCRAVENQEQACGDDSKIRQAFATRIGKTQAEAKKKAKKAAKAKLGRQAKHDSCVCVNSKGKKFETKGGGKNR